MILRDGPERTVVQHMRWLKRPEVSSWSNDPDLEQAPSPIGRLPRFGTPSVGRCLLVASISRWRQRDRVRGDAARPDCGRGLRQCAAPLRLAQWGCHGRVARRGDVLDCEEPPRIGRAPAVVLKELREYLMLSWLYCGCCNGVYVVVLCWGVPHQAHCPSTARRARWARSCACCAWASCGTCASDPRCCSARAGHRPCTRRCT